MQLQNVDKKPHTGEMSFAQFPKARSTILMYFKVHCPICELCQSLNDVNEKPLRAVECGWGCSIANGVPNCLLINKVALANFEGLSQAGGRAEFSKTLRSSPI
jgi:hypothetical protein